MFSIKEQLEDPNEMYHTMTKDAATNLRVAMPGIIQSYNSSTQTAEVQVAIREKVRLNGDVTDTEIPLLVDVPVMMLRAGGYMVEVTPIAGDECLVVFADSCYDAWWQSGGVQSQLDKRRHDLSDGIAILGLWSQPNVISSGGAGIRLRNISGSTKVEIVGSDINLTGGNVNINASNLNINVTGYSLTAQTSVSNGNGNSTIDGKKFLTHEHTGVQSGGSNTGGVA